MRKTTIVVVLAVALGTWTRPATAGLNRWTSHSPAGADIVSIAADSTGQTVYAATAGSGMYKSTDAGEHWSAVNNGLALTLSSVAVDPADPSVAYAGADGLVFTTTDGGESWIRRSAPLGYPPLALAVGPDPRTLYVALAYSAFRSTNGGETWEKGVQKNITSMAVLDRRTFLGTDLGLFFSDDWLTWQMAPTLGGPVLAVASEAGTQDVFVATQSTLFASHDRGATWKALSNVSGKVSTLTTANGRLYAATSDGLFQFDGSQWALFNSGLADIPVSTITAVQSKSQLLAATTVGLFKTDIAAAAWRAAGRGFGRAAANDVSIAPHDPHIAIAATQLGIFKTVDRGETWDQTFREAATHVRVSAAAPRIVYATDAKTILKSNDEGQHWDGIHASRVTSGIDVAPDGQTVYAALSGGMSKTTDGGINWAMATGGLNGYYAFYDDYTVDAIAVNPTNSSEAYTAQWDGLYATKNGGQMWAITPGESSAAIAIDPNSPARVYTARKGSERGLLVTTDGGAHWVIDAVAAGERIVSVVVSPADSSVYAATDRGHLYTRMPAATTWTRMDAGLPAVPVNGISVSASGNTLYAATSAGIYEYDRSTATFVEVPADATLLSHLLDQTASSDGSQFLIPIAGAGQGAHGTSFMTDLLISNGLERDQDMLIAWLPAGSAAPLSARRITVPAASNGPFVADSIADDLGANGIGTLIVTAVTSSGEVDLNAQINGSVRIWTTAAESGETSQSVAAVHPAALRSPGAANITSLRQDSAFRTNIGIVNLDSRPQQFVVDARGERHHESFTVIVPPLSLLHVPLPGGDYGELQVTVSTTGGSRWTAYGTTIDNDTGAATTTIGRS